MVEPWEGCRSDVEELWNRTGRKGAEESRSLEADMGKSLLEKSPTKIKTVRLQIQVWKVLNI